MIKISKMNLRLLLAVSLLNLISCNMKVLILSDNRTAVPKDPNVYKNKNKFDKSLLSIIDTSVIYEEYSAEKKILERLDILDNIRKRYIVYKFYPNGCFNVFAFLKKDIPEIYEFDPSYAGNRGIYYMENNQIRYELFTGIDEVGHLGRVKGTFRVVGDTLYDKMDDRKGIDAASYSTEIYIKRKLPPEYFQYKANW